MADRVVVAVPAILDAYTLFDCGSFPGARPSSEDHVHGELFHVYGPREALVPLDALEDHPHLYRRRRRLVRSGGCRVRAWVYVLVRLRSLAPCRSRWPPVPVEGGWPT